ncbi:MAG: histidine kinase [Planctomycetota bacterium]
MTAAPESGEDQSNVEGKVDAVVFLSGDLMFASRVRAAAEASDLEFHFGGAVPDIKSEIAWVIVDLATRSGAVDDLADTCREKCPDAKLIAFGPHVHVARLEKARAAGIPTVLTRGQFDRALASLFSSDALSE